MTTRPRPADVHGADGIPAIVDVRTAYVRFARPRKRARGSEVVDVHDAVEITIRTAAPLDLSRASSPLLYLGDRPVPRVEAIGPNQYKFTLYDYRDVPRGAAVALGMPHTPPASRAVAVARYEPRGLPTGVA